MQPTRSFFAEGLHQLPRLELLLAESEVHIHLTGEHPGFAI
jgi:hypothetical protein